MRNIRIATRRSRLAVWQAQEVARRLAVAHPGLSCELVPMTTRGDRFVEAPLGEIGGKGLFVKELEQALLDGQADIAVHSMKDVTADLPAGLDLPVILARANPFDALVSLSGRTLPELQGGARVGSSSLRRKSQIRALRPDLAVEDVRGNVDTRLAKLDAGEFDALVLACAGLERLGLAARISQVLGLDEMVPAIAQGAMGIECRDDDPRVGALIAPLHDVVTATAIAAERAVNAGLGGGCHVPVGGYATIDGGTVTLRAVVGTTDGRTILRKESSASVERAEHLGAEVAAALRAAGADRILAELGVQQE